MALGFGLASRLLSAIPRSVTLPLARALGRASWWVLPDRRRVAKENLACALGEVDERTRGRIARASFGHAAAIAADLLTLPRVARDVAADCEAEPGSLETLEAARARGRGVILVAGHFGLFESMGIFLGASGFPVTFVAKPFENPRLDAVVNRLRAATGNAFIHKGGAKAKVRGVLEAGGLVAVVVDQHVTRWDRLWIPFFGLDAATTRSLGTLAEETGAAVVPIHAYPAPRGRCRCAFGPIVVAPAGGAEALVHAVIREMERATRRMPEAWLWMHRRWKVRPDGTLGYPSYSRTESEERAFIEARDAHLGRDEAGRGE
jgi:KDO2-lipid IV(A) lauroyltransferase